jgi:hypothetical protein
MPTTKTTLTDNDLYDLRDALIFAEARCKQPELNSLTTAAKYAVLFIKIGEILQDRQKGNSNA